MEWVPVESGVIRAVAYEAEARHLYIEFPSGDVYRYLFIYPGQYREFMAAESKGRYFAQHIRDKFPFEKVAREAAGLGGDAVAAGA